MKDLEKEKSNLMENVASIEDTAKAFSPDEETQVLANGIMPLSAVTNYKLLEQNIVGGKNVLTQKMIEQANTRYVIRYEYDLNGATLTVPKGCVLDFQAGSLKNGTLVGNNTYIESPLVQIFYTTLTLSGTYLSFDGYGRVEWYGCYPSQTSVDFKDAYNAISRVFVAVQLQAGQYVTNKGEIQMALKIRGAEFAGEYKKKSEILIHIPEGSAPKYGLCIGKREGGIDERITGCTLDNVTITTTAVNRIRGYHGVVIGAVTRCMLKNVVVWQYTAQTVLTSSELTSNSLSDRVLNVTEHKINSIARANVCIAFDGNTEQVVIDGCHTYGDIGYAFLTPTDFVSIINSLIAQSSYGVASIYMKAHAANLYINNTSMDLGQYGLYLDDVDKDATAPYNSIVNFNMSNCRIEQLRPDIFDASGFVVGASIYIGKQKYIGPMVFNDIMYGGTNNGVIIRNSANGGNITFNNCSMFEDSTIKKYIHQFGSPDKTGKFPRVNLNYHHNSNRSAEETIRILDDRIKLSAPIEQIKMRNQSINHFDHIVAYQYDYTMTEISKEPIKGLRIVDNLLNLSPDESTISGSYYVLPEYNATNVNKANFVGIIAEISYINDNKLESAKILFKRDMVTTLESTSGIIAHNSWDSSQSNKLYVIYSRVDQFSYLVNRFNKKINVRIKMECIYSDSNQY